MYAHMLMLLASLVLLSSYSYADVYKYVDTQGNAHLTNAPIVSDTNEKEIKIGYLLLLPDKVILSFNVPVTYQMQQVITNQKGVASIAISGVSKYDLYIYIGKMCSRKEVIDNVITALKVYIFTDKTVKVYQLK
jgi:hypothetical protein